MEDPRTLDLANPEDGFHLGWNLADLGQSRRQGVVDAIEAAVGTGAVEQISTVYARFPDCADYRHMAQVRMRLAAAVTVAAAFFGTSCSAVGPQFI
eukprot:491536-Pyramimonas_sp.AAC.1